MKMMLKQTLRNAARRVAPRYVLDGYHHLKLVNQARRLAALRDASEDPRAWMDDLMRSHFFRPLQKRTEILRLLGIIRALRPATICEIGAAGGGTTFLFAHAAPPDSLIITVDVTFTRSRRAAVRRFASARQKIVCLQGDSRGRETRGAVADGLEGRGLDVLYLDGDHSYEGISADFESYSPLVRAGGIIVFHDIVPDFKTRYGVETASNTGGVPQFWRELKAAHRTVEEIVEDPAQDGFGIGVLRWEGGQTRNA